MEHISIKNITIKNIKGFGDPEVSLNVDLKPNRVNILYAPNGFGKSSIAAAFNSLKPKSLDVPLEYCHHKDETLSSELRLTIGDDILVANKSQNLISPILSCKVIKNNLDVETIQHNMGRFTSVSAFINIPPIEVVSKVPENLPSTYSISELRKKFGTNGKVLDNLSSLFTSREFLCIIAESFLSLDIFVRAKKRTDIILNIVSQINAMRGTADVIKKNIDNSMFNDLFCQEKCNEILTHNSSLLEGKSAFERFSFIYQLIEWWKLHRNEIKQSNERAEYELFLERFNKDLSLFDTTWKNIQAVESKGKLLVNYPKADEISNGQRDVLTFATQLIAFKASLKPGKKYLLIIDEVFDYLDDANTIVGQYYLSNFLNLYKGDIYLCLLTHLSPKTFRSYIFNSKMINDVYLKPTLPCASDSMMAFIAFREGLDKMNNSEQKNLYDDLSHDLFHYNPITVDYSARINQFKHNQSLKVSWGKTTVLHKYLIEETNKYFNDSEEYDPYAVAMSLRLRVEKLVYMSLDSQEKKTSFIDEKMTKRKFDYAEREGVIIPDIYNIVNAIHNEADHIKFNEDRRTYDQTPIVYKLQNIVIRDIVKHLFSYKNGEQISVNCIE